MEEVVGRPRGGGGGTSPGLFRRLSLLSGVGDNVWVGSCPGLRQEVGRCTRVVLVVRLSFKDEFNPPPLSPAHTV